MGGRPVEGDLQRFMRRAREAVAAQDGEAARREIGRLLGELSRSGAIALDGVEVGLHGSTATASTVLARDPGGLTLMLLRLSADESTPVHDHKSWGVAYTLRGTDRHKHWRRLDDGSEPGRGRVAVDDEREVGEGEFVDWPDPPHDIHSQQGVGGPAYELVCFGRDPMAALRDYYDPERGTVRQELAR